MPWRAVTIGNRRPAAILSAPFKRAHYRSFFRAFSVVSAPVDHLTRYVGGTGEYPYACEVRTPLGAVAIELHSSHDVATVTEVFCREDYRCRPDVDVIVDFGSNIGASGLYFLTRNPACRAYLFEPDPQNASRLRSNLARFADRAHLTEAAIVASASPRDVVSFSPEPTGRYGRIVDGTHPGEAITVRAVAINEALRDVLARERHVDVLKIDTEGSELDLVAALAPDVLSKVDVICFESDAPNPLHLDQFGHTREMNVNRLTRREAVRV